MCIRDSPFPIRYCYKENGGKCRAINYGLKLAQGELFFTVDSDDYLTDDALEKVALWESTLPKDQKFCGIVANGGQSPTETPNTRFEEDVYKRQEWKTTGWKIRSTSIFPCGYCG